MSNCHLVAGRSLIDLTASRLALCTPALRAATALTRPNRSAQRLPCGRHAVPTTKTVGPSDVVANHRIECRDHLPHHCHDHDLRQFAGTFQTIVKEFEHRIPIAGAHRGHVEHLADVCTTAPDTASAPERAALEGVRRNTDQSSDLFAAHAAELGQERNQRATGSTPGIDVSSWYRCASVASVATISTKRLLSSSMSAASLAIRRRERCCNIRSSSSLEAFSAAVFSALSWRRTASISTSCSAAGVVRCAGRVGMMPTNEAIIRASSGSFLARTPLALANCLSLKGLTWRTGMPAACNERTAPRS